MVCHAGGGDGVYGSPALKGGSSPFRSLYRSRDVIFDARSAARTGYFRFGESNQSHLPRHRARLGRRGGFSTVLFRCAILLREKVQGIHSSLRAPRCARRTRARLPWRAVRGCAAHPCMPARRFATRPCTAKNARLPGAPRMIIPCGPDPRRPAVLGATQGATPKPKPQTPNLKPSRSSDVALRFDVFLPARRASHRPRRKRPDRGAPGVKRIKARVRWTLTPLNGLATEGKPWAFTREQGERSVKARVGRRTGKSCRANPRLDREAQGSAPVARER